MRPWSCWKTWCLLIACLCGAQVFKFASCQTPPASKPTASEAYLIAGTIVSKSDGHPLDHATVVLGDVKNQKVIQTMFTSDDGRFQFQGLAAGKYTLAGQRQGYINSAYDSHEQFSTAIVTGADFDTEHLALRLAPAGFIWGKVLDESSEPVRHAMVTVYFENHSSGIGQVQAFRFAQTDDEGAYEVTSLLPGKYFVSANGTPWYAVHPNAQVEAPGLPPVSVDPSLDVTYPLTYYGDETEAEQASPIRIQGGERMQADIHLRPVHALTLRFLVPNNGQNGTRVPQLEQTGFDGNTTYVQGTGFNMVSRGVMEITGIPAGRYNVRINGEGSAAEMSGLELTKDGQELDTAIAEALSNVKMTVRIAGEEGMPRRVVVWLHSGRGQVAGQVDSKGEVDFQPMPAGVYDVVTWNFGKPYAFDHMTVDGAAVQGHKVSVASGSSPSIVLTLVPGNLQVQGVVKRAGKGIAGAMVVLVPKNPELHRELFRRDQSDMDGTFSIPGIVPGSYTILAIENGWELDWAEPGVIAAYVKRGRSVELTIQMGSPIDLGVPIEVQVR